MDIAIKNLAFAFILLMSSLMAFEGGEGDVEVNTYTSDEAGNIVVAPKTDYLAGEDIIVSITLTGKTKDDPDLSRIRILGEFSNIDTNKKLGGVIPSSGSLESGEAGPYNWTISSTFISSTLGRDVDGEEYEDYNGDGLNDYIGLIEFTIFVDNKTGNNYDLIAESSVSVAIFSPESNDGGLEILSNIPIEGLIGFVAFLGIVATGTYLMTRETEDSIIDEDAPSSLSSGLGMGLGSSLLGSDSDDDDDDDDDKPKKKKTLASKTKIGAKKGKKKMKPPKSKTKEPPKPKDKPKYCPECNSVVQFWSREVYEHDYETEYHCEKCELYIEPILEQNFKRESRTRRGRKDRAGRKAERERKGRTRDRDRGPRSLV